MLCASVVCCTNLIKFLVNIDIEANSVDPDQTAPAPVGAVRSGFTLFDSIQQSHLDLHCSLKRLLKHFSR